MTAISALAERAAFLLSATLGRLLRNSRYSAVRLAERDGRREVRKVRLFYAPLLVRIVGLLMKVLDTGVRVLPQREWEERERELHQRLRGTSIRVEPGGVLVLPRLAGETLAAVLEDPELDVSVRRRAIELAVVALAQFHRLGLTHGDAMAENVMVDLEAGVAHWFDFETVHDTSRPLAWRRADDVRALLVTCLLRTSRGERPGTIRHILDACGGDEAARLVAANVSTAMRSPLAFHLGQAGLSFEDFREIAELLSERATQRSPADDGASCRPLQPSAPEHDARP